MKHASWCGGKCSAILSWDLETSVSEGGDNCLQLERERGGGEGERERGGGWGGGREVIKRGNRRDCSVGVSLELLKYVFQAKVVCLLLLLFVFVCLLFLLIVGSLGVKHQVTLLVNRFRFCFV